MKRALCMCLTLSTLIAIGMGARAVAADFQRDLLAYLPLESDLLDHGPSRFPVTGTNVVISQGAAYFKGQTNWLQLPYIPLKEKPFAVSVWIKPTGTHAMYGLLEQKDEKRSHHWLHLMLRGGRQPYLGFYINDVISPRDIKVGEWSHIVFQYNGKQQEIWVDGEFLCNRETTAYAGGKGVTKIGWSPRWNNVPSRDYEGYMREVRIYGRALSPVEIRILNDPSLAQSQSKLSLQVVPAPLITVPRKSWGTAAPEYGAPLLSINGNKLVVTGEDRQIYEIQTTTDLAKPWESLVTITNRGLGGMFEFIDEAAQGRNRYYRIQVKGLQ